MSNRSETSFIAQFLAQWRTLTEAEKRAFLNKLDQMEGASK